MIIRKLLEKIKNKLLLSNFFNVCMIIIVSGFLFGLPIFQNEMTWRTDAYFHLSRIFDLSNYLRNFQVPLIVNLYSFANTGQAINGMYPFFSITPLLFITSHLSPIQQYFTMNWLFILSGSLLNYFVFQKMGASKIRSLASVMVIASFINIYAFSSFSLQGVWSIYFMFPLAVLSISKLTENNWWYVLTLSMSISFMLNTHLLSALLSTLLLIFYYTYIFLKSKNKLQILIKTFVSVLVFIILSLSTLINIVSISKDSLTSLETFQLTDGTVNIEQMLHSLTNPSIFGVSVPSIFGSLLLLDILFVFFWKQLNSNTHIIFVLALILQIIVSPYFPWDLLQKTPISTIQFPARLVPLILIILVIALATDKYFDNIKLIMGILLFSCLLTLSFQTSNTAAKLHFPFFPSQLSSYDHEEFDLLNFRENTLLTNSDLKNSTFYRLKTYPEYMPKKVNSHDNRDSDSVNKHIIFINNKPITNVSVYVTGNTINYAFKNYVSGNVDLPLWKYTAVNYSTLHYSNQPLKLSKRHTITLNTKKTKLIQVRVTNSQIVNSSFWITIFAWISSLIAIMMKLVYFRTTNSINYKN